SATVTSTPAVLHTRRSSDIGLPAGASFGAATKTFSWTPTFDQAGPYPGVIFTVSDGTASATETVAITVGNTNRAPVLAPIGNKSGSEGSLLTVTVAATDVQSDVLTDSACWLPPRAIFEPAP